MGRMIVINPDGDPDKDRNMVQNLLGLYLFLSLCLSLCFSVYISLSEMCGLRTCLSADEIRRNFFADAD